MRFVRRRRHLVLACLVLLLLSLWPNIYKVKPLVVDVEADTSFLKQKQRPRIRIDQAGQYGNTHYGADEYEYSTDSPPCRKFFTVWPRDSHDWLDSKTIALESIFRYDPCAQVFVYTNELPLEFFDSFVDAGFFIRIERYDLTTLTENIMGSKYAETNFDVRERKKSHNYALHEVSFVRAVLLYRYGGSYTSLDYLMLPNSRTINTYRNVLGAEHCEADYPGSFDIHYLPGLETVGAVYHFPNNAYTSASATILLDWDSKHKLMERILYEFDNYHNPSCAECTGDELVGTLVPQFATSVTLVAEELMFSVRINQVNPQDYTVGTSYCDLAMSSGFGYKLHDSRTHTQYNLEHETTAQCLAKRIRIRPNVTYPFDTARSPIRAVLKQAYNPQDMLVSLSCTDAKRIPRERNVAVVILISGQEANDMQTILQSFVGSRYVREFVIWNNNADSPLTAQSVYLIYTALLHTTESTYSKRDNGPFVPCIRVYNIEPGMNVLSLGRYAACLSSTSALCYFQDGGYKVQGTEALFHLANREPHRLHSLATAEGIRAAHMWKFNDVSEHIGLHAQYSGVSTGACVSREVVQRYVLQLLASRISSTDRTMADYHFSVWTNVPLDILEGDITKLPNAAGEEMETLNGPLSAVDSHWDLAQIKFSVDKLYEILTDAQYASVRHLFRSYDFSTPSWYNTVSGEEQLRRLDKHIYTRTVLDPLHTPPEQPVTLLREPSLFAGCTVQHRDYQGIVRTDASRYSRVHPPLYEPGLALETQLRIKNRPEYQLRHLVDTQHTTHFTPFMDKTCHNITLELVQPVSCSYVAVSLSSGAESVQVVVRLAKSGRILNIGKHRLDRRTGKQTIAAGRKGVMLESDYSNGMRHEEYKVQSLLISWVAVEVCARVTENREVPIDVYDLSLVTQR